MPNWASHAHYPNAKKIKTKISFKTFFFKSHQFSLTCSILWSLSHTNQTIFTATPKRQTNVKCLHCRTCLIFQMIESILFCIIAKHPILIYLLLSSLACLIKHAFLSCIHSIQIYSQSSNAYTFLYIDNWFQICVRFCFIAGYTTRFPIVPPLSVISHLSLVLYALLIDKII